jgi:hypothetical protein
MERTKQELEDIMKAILKCATNCYFSGLNQLSPAADVIEKEFLVCMQEINLIIEGSGGDNEKTTIHSDGHAT